MCEFAGLAGVILRRFDGASLKQPLPDEREPAYTARVLVPSVRDILDQAGTRELLVGGDGASQTRTVSFLNRFFHPDIVITHRGRRLLAIEVKLVRATDQQAIATGIGQTLIYGAAYSMTGLLLVDVSASMPESSRTIARSLLSDRDIAIAIADAP